ncbi:MAG: Holliday junction branch migration protein RuvA [Bacteroidota bacterium]
MFAFINGKLVEKNPAYAVIEACGVGYMLNISLYTYEKLNNIENCKLYAHLVVKEDAHTLYGFIDENERDVFRHLISVSGIGPNTARMMLSAMKPDDVCQAVAMGNVSLLQSIKGIGGKTAQRIIIELKDKLSKKTVLSENFSIAYNKVQQEALSGLIMLGFVRIVAEKAILKVIKSADENLSVEELIKRALKIL